MHEGVLATKLTTQYRMNDAIASWASKEMYRGLLKSSSSVASHLLVDSPFVKVRVLATYGYSLRFQLWFQTVLQFSFLHLDMVV